jgi:hypothetical protein
MSYTKPDKALTPSTLGVMFETWLKMLIKTRKLTTNRDILPIQYNISFDYLTFKAINL